MKRLELIATEGTLVEHVNEIERTLELLEKDGLDYNVNETQHFVSSVVNHRGHNVTKSEFLTRINIWGREDVYPVGVKPVMVEEDVAEGQVTVDEVLEDVSLEEDINEEVVTKGIEITD